MKTFDDISDFAASPQMCGVLFLISFLGYMFFNQAMPITDPVEANYVLTAKEMVLTADWVSPRIYGNVWFDKPVFFYWLTAIAFQLFGFSEWAARLMPALFAGAGVALLYWFTSKITTPRTAFLAVVIMGTSFEYILLAKLVLTDMVFFVFNCAALGFFYLGYVKMDGTKRWYLAAYVSMALAVLTKGPVGVLLPGLVMLLVITLQRNWAELAAMFLPTGIFLFAVVALPWYAAMYALHGPEFINNFFGVHNYLRATVSEHPKDNVSYYYLGVFVLSVLPWSALAIKALFQGCKDLRARTSSPLLLFLLLWIAAYFVFYSLMATKYLTYTFPILFPTAILTAVQLERMFAQNKAASIFYWTGVPMALLMFIYMIAAYRYLAGWEFSLAACSLLLLLVLSAWKARNRTAADVFKLLCLCQLGSYIILSLFIFPVIAESRSGKGTAESMTGLGAEKIGMYQFYSTSAVFYSGKVAVKLTPSAEAASQPEGLDWSSKYTMPTQAVADFGTEPPLSDRLIIVEDKQREQFLLEAATFNYQLLKNSKGLSYYTITE